jgi:HlyD family secretion protein
VVTYETVLKVDNQDLSLRPGMTATADIVVKKVENAILVPGASLRFTPLVRREEKASNGLISTLLPHPPMPGTQQPEDAGSKKQQRVWILKDGQLLAVPVTIGSTNGAMTEILTGEIQPGMAVIVDAVSSAE